MPTTWYNMDEVANNVIDVLAIRYDAALNAFTVHRFCGCVVVDGKVVWVLPFYGSKDKWVLEEVGYKPVRWAHAPNAPEDLDDGPEVVRMIAGPTIPKGTTYAALEPSHD